MKMRSTLVALLACLVSTFLAAWLLGGLVSFVVDEMDPDARDILILANAPWFMGEQALPAASSSDAARRSPQ